VGTTVVAGMAAATVLSVFFIPVLYYAIVILQEKLTGRRAPAAEAGPAGGGEGGRP
jgi:multidrug efflux pump